MIEKGKIISYFRNDKLALTGIIGVIFMISLAIFAPLLANGRPLLIISDSTGLSFPFLRYLFAPDTNEFVVEKIFNFLLLYLPIAIIIMTVSHYIKLGKVKRNYTFIITALLLLIPFFTVQQRMDKTNWRARAVKMSKTEKAFFAPVPFGPFEIVGKPYQETSAEHICGCDEIGRDVFSRIVYGARVSLAVGVIATIISLVIGTTIGLITGYFGGTIDMIMMRIVEIIICFPTFLLLLILMAIMIDRKFDQSILLVIAVLGLTSWTGISRIIRGEVLQQRQMAYIMSCESQGVPVWRIMIYHLLPNVMAPLLIYFTFGVAGAVMAESGLSFLGFGVQAPTASWGELSRQAFSNPFRYWHLTLWPGVLIFLTVSSFNFTGEGIRRLVDPKAE